MYALIPNLLLMSYAGIPTAIGFAVLKYRLYDIDIIINRALVYGPLTVSLAAVYFGGVVGDRRPPSAPLPARSSSRNSPWSSPRWR